MATKERAARVARWLDDLVYLLDKEDRNWLVAQLFSTATAKQISLLREVAELERHVDITFWTTRAGLEPVTHERLREHGDYWDGGTGNGKSWFRSRQAEQNYLKQSYEGDQ